MALKGRLTGRLTSAAPCDPRQGPAWYAMQCTSSGGCCGGSSSSNSCVFAAAPLVAPPQHALPMEVTQVVLSCRGLPHAERLAVVLSSVLVSTFQHVVAPLSGSCHDPCGRWSVVLVHGRDVSAVSAADDSFHWHCNDSSGHPLSQILLHCSTCMPQVACCCHDNRCLLELWAMRDQLTWLAITHTVTVCC